MPVKMTTKQARSLGLYPPGSPKKHRKAKMQAANDGKQGRDRAFDAACKAFGLPPPIHEYRFAPPRKWRFDYCWPQADIALEVQGGLFINGRHNRGAALLKEHAKLNQAVILGWSVMFCTPTDIEIGAIFPILKQAILGV